MSIRRGRLWADLSSNNPHFDAKAYRKAGHRLLGVKATEGVTFNDPAHEKLVSAAHGVGVKVAHYHFARPDNNQPAAEAKHFWKVVQPRFKKGDLLVLDLERHHRLGMHATGPWAVAFMAALRKASGRRAILYTGAYFIMECGESIKPAMWRVWLAAYTKKRLKIPYGGRFWAWQYTGDGHGNPPHTLPGCPQNCDVSILNRRSYLWMLGR